MAKVDNKTIIYVFLMFVFAGIMITTEGRIIPRGRDPACTSVVGVQSGDSCFSIAQKFKLSSGFFDYINPNLNCHKLFVGEWICVDGI
ncbi:putative LysM domain-containing protein [Helianthus anomalus]